MLPAAVRLRHRDEFAGVLRRGRRVTCGPLVFHFADGVGPDVLHRFPTDRSVSQWESPRVGFVISGKVGDAVRRNLLRRRLRSALRDRLEMLPPRGALVVRALPGAAQLDYRALTGLVDDALRALARS